MNAAAVSAIVLIAAAVLFGLVMLGALVVLVVSGARHRDAWQTVAHTETTNQKD